MSNNGGYIPTLDFYHWTHYWMSPFTQQLAGSKLPAIPPNNGFPGSGPPITTPLNSIPGAPRVQTDARPALTNAR